MKFWALSEKAENKRTVNDGETVKFKDAHSISVIIPYLPQWEEELFSWKARGQSVVKTFSFVELPTLFFFSFLSFFRSFLLSRLSLRLLLFSFFRRFRASSESLPLNEGDRECLRLRFSP